jgi:hypothetical protein
MTPAAEAGAENNPVIAALKRCATQNQEYEFFWGGLNFLGRLAESHTTIIIPFDDCVIFVRLLTVPKSRRHSGLPKPSTRSRDSVPIGGCGIGERWLTARSSQVSLGVTGRFGALSSLGIGLLALWGIIHGFFPGLNSTLGCDSYLSSYRYRSIETDRLGKNNWLVQTAQFWQLT